MRFIASKYTGNYILATDLACLLLEGKLGAHLTRMGNKGGMLFLYNGPIVNLKQLGASVARFIGGIAAVNIQRSARFSLIWGAKCRRPRPVQKLFISK